MVLVFLSVPPVAQTLSRTACWIAGGLWQFEGLHRDFRMESGTHLPLELQVQWRFFHDKPFTTLLQTSTNAAWQKVIGGKTCRLGCAHPVLCPITHCTNPQVQHSRSRRSEAGTQRRPSGLPPNTEYLLRQPSLVEAERIPVTFINLIGYELVEQLFTNDMTHALCQLRVHKSNNLNRTKHFFLIISSRKPTRNNGHDVLRCSQRRPRTRQTPRFAFSSGGKTFLCTCHGARKPNQIFLRSSRQPWAEVKRAVCSTNCFDRLCPL